jgi:lysylphosphatidylglycerol synthetase-like protein (DUF2156 family)
MPFCPSCGKPIDENAAFCPSCGASLKVAPPPISSSPQAMGTDGRRAGRPVGVTIIAVLDALAGLLLLLGGGTMFGYSSMMGLYGGPLASYHGLLTAFGVLFVVVGLVTMFLAWGVWTGAGWAWTAALVIAVLSSVLHLLSFNVVSLAINVIVVVYLMQPSVKLYFGH